MAWLPTHHSLWPRTGSENRFPKHAGVASRPFRALWASPPQVTPSLTCGNVFKTSWRWGESNPRPSVPRWAFSERSRCEGLRPALDTGNSGGPQLT